MEKFIVGLFAAVGLIVVAVVASTIGAFFVQWGWNATMPEIFGLIEISWTQGFWLCVLGQSLFKSTQTNNNK